MKKFIFLLLVLFALSPVALAEETEVTYFPEYQELHPDGVHYWYSSNKHHVFVCDGYYMLSSGPDQDVRDVSCIWKRWAVFYNGGNPKFWLRINALKAL